VTLPRLRSHRPARERAGFTLAEVAVTLVIVGIALTLILQGLNTAKISAAQTHNRKVARELALWTLGEIEGGLYQEDLGSRTDILAGTYAEQGFEAWRFEVVLGDESFIESSTAEYDDAYHDSWIAEREREARQRERDDEDDGEDPAEEETEPFEKVRIKVSHPRFGDRPNELILERWIPWNLVYGEPEEDEEAPPPADEEEG
jgi:prepilin-type N-terminal cleavage/methylation domain-containing protein